MRFRKAHTQTWKTKYQSHDQVCDTSMTRPNTRGMTKPDVTRTVPLRERQRERERDRQTDRQTETER